MRHLAILLLFGRSPGNGLVVVSGTEAAVLDTPWTDEETEQLFAWVAESLGAKVTTVVVTHSHGDCLGGGAWILRSHLSGGLRRLTHSIPKERST